MENLIHEVHRLYLESQQQLSDANSKNEPSEYLRGKTDAFYTVLSMIHMGKADK